MKELIELLKANPGKYSYASPGYGTSPHVAVERLFKLAHELDIVQVPFQGGGPAVMSTIAGHTQILHITLPLVAGHIKEGKLRGLAVADAKRSRAPCRMFRHLNEAGITKHDVGYWTGVMVPAGTPDRIVSLLNRAIGKVLSSPGREGAAGKDRLRSDARHEPNLRSSCRRRIGGVGSGHSAGEHQDRLTLMAPSNQTAVLRPPKKEGAEISTTTGRRGAERSRQNGFSRSLTRSGDRKHCSARWSLTYSRSLPKVLSILQLSRAGSAFTNAARATSSTRWSRSAALWRDADGRYGNDPEFDLYLDRRKPTYLGGLLEHLNARHYQNWGLADRGRFAPALPRAAASAPTRRSTMVIRCKRYS